LARYRQTSPDQAHLQKFLLSAYNCIRWFWNVKQWDARTRTWERGDDFDRAIAFRPANDAFCNKKIALLRCQELGYLERYRFVNDIHDAFMFHCPVTLVEECIVNVQREMERPSEVMLMPDGSGFSCEVDVKAGRTWAFMKSDWKSVAVGC
jgi:hypothetical protein